HRVGLRDIRRNRRRLAARAGNAFRQRIRLSGALAIIDRDRGAGLGQRSHDRRTDAARAAGYQRGAPAQIACRHGHLRPYPCETEVIIWPEWCLLPASVAAMNIAEPCFVIEEK